MLSGSDTFSRGKPVQLFTKPESTPPESTEEPPSAEAVEEARPEEEQTKPDAMVTDDENPF